MELLLFVVPKDIVDYIIYQYLYYIKPKHTLKNRYDKILYSGKIYALQKDIVLTTENNEIKRYSMDVPHGVFGNVFYKICRISNFNRIYHIYEHCTELTCYRFSDSRQITYELPDYHLTKFCADGIASAQLFTTYIFGLITNFEYKRTDIVKYLYKNEDSTFGGIPHFEKIKNVLSFNEMLTDISDYFHELYVYNTNTIYVINKNKNAVLVSFHVECESMSFVKVIKSPILISKMYQNIILSANERSIELYDLKLLDVIYVKDKIKTIDVSNNALIVNCHKKIFVYLLDELLEGQV